MPAREATSSRRRPETPLRVPLSLGLPRRPERWFGTRMTDKNVWLITGAARGMGLDIAKAALAAGHAVVATARNTDSVTAAWGQDDALLAVALDVTDPAAAE